MRELQKLFKNLYVRVAYRILPYVSAKSFVSLRYELSHGRKLNWDHPQDIDEKINWLKFNADTTAWVRLADKYAVREYVAEKGFGDMLVPLLGKWDSVEEIDWDSLPTQFVMKVNNGSGDVMVCTDKDSINRDEWNHYFNKMLHTKFGNQMGEPHYNKIRPCILAEELLDATKQDIPSTSLVDYKIWSFDGKPAYVWVCYNRTKHSTDVAVYDLDWNFHPEFSVSCPHYVLKHEPLPRPKSLDRMLEAASALTQGFPEVRFDCDEVDGKAYFGEMTFSAAAGFNYFYTQEFLNKLGSLTLLSNS